MPPLGYPSPQLADEVVVLRRWTVTDVECAMEGKDYGREDALAWITAQWERQSVGAGMSLAIADPRRDEALGCIGLQYRPRAGVAPWGHEPGVGLAFEPDRAMVGVGYWVIERGRRRGLATHAVSLASNWALSQGIARIEALTELDNIASQRVLERSGYAREGRLAAYLSVNGGRADAFVYARTSRVTVS